MRSVASPRADPEPPLDWHERFPPAAGSDHRFGAHRSRRNRERLNVQTDLAAVWILAPDGERALEVSIRDGVELGAVATTILCAASAAAPKDARFVPYNNNWTVPPIIWLMTIGESGTRKSLLDDIGFCVLRTAQGDLWRPHRERMKV